MKAVRLHQYGSPEVLSLDEVPVPEPASGEVLIKVAAAGVNYADVMRRRNDSYPEPTPLPFTLGIEVAGTVAAVGDGVTFPSVGTLVFAAPGAGGYAQYVAVPAKQVIPIPPQLDAVKAAAIVVQGLTASLVLNIAGRLQPGESVLIQGAAGGVGTLAVQLAKLFGAGHVIAAASSPAKLELAQSLGADSLVNYTQKNWAQQVLDATNGHGADLILEMTGGSIMEQSLDCLAAFGRMVIYGAASGKPVALNPQGLLPLNQSITGFYLGNYFSSHPELIQSRLRELVEAIVSDRLKLHIGAVLPLAKAAEAHRLLETRQTTGKVVLEPWADA